MAASGEQTALGQMGQEASCPLCLDLFEQPMGLSCGHNFCRDCLAQLGAEFSCPECRAKVDPSSACPNRALANIVCHLKRLRLSEGAQEESSGHRLCREHGQPLQNFCSNKKSLLCSGCLEGHQGCPLLSLPQAAQEYKDLLDGLLEPLRKEGQKLLEQRQAEEQSRQECQEQFAAEKQKVVAWLAEQEEKMEAEWGDALAQLSGEASRLQQLMAQMQRKCRQPDGEFLQDIQDTIARCRGYMVGRIESVSPRLQDKLRTLLEKNASVRQVVDSFKAPAPEKPRSPKVWVMLNSSTAHPRLQCRRGRVSWASRCQECPDVPERFDRELCVLGCEGFTTGCHWWEVSIEVEPYSAARGTAHWAIGVAKESVRRKARLQLSPQEGIWAVGQSVQGENVAFSNVQRKLSWQNKLRNLRVRLDCEAKIVEFLDPDWEFTFCTLQTGPLLGETLRPFFYVGGKGLTLQCEELPVPIMLRS